jgi:ATP diphosphatase
MPALMEAHKISSKAAHVGFDWPEINGLFEKLTEETGELREQLEQLPSDSLKPDSKAKIPSDLHARIEDEIGDLFFVMVNLARRLSVDPESALRRTNRKFRSRFGWLEQQLQERGTSLEDAPLEVMEELWQRAKLSEEGR